MMWNSKQLFGAAALAASVLMSLNGCGPCPHCVEGVHHDPAPVKAAEPAKPAAVASSGPCSYRPTVGSGGSLSEMFFPTGDARSSALVVHQVSPQSVRAGQTYPFEIHVTNITGGTLQSVMLTLDNAQNLNVESSTPAMTKTANGGGQWMIGDLGACKTSVVKLTGVASNVGTATNCIMVSYANVLCSGVQVVQPALQLTKTITPEAMICDPITMTLEIKNSGTGNADNVRIADALPAGLATTDNKTSLDIPIGTLKAGEAKKVTVNLKASKTGKFDNKASASADGGLKAESATVSTMVHQPVLAIECKAGGNVMVGRESSFTFTVRNTGDAACNNTTVTATTNGTVTKADNGGTTSANGVTWNVGSLAAGASKTLTMNVKGAGIGDVTASATANCVCATAASTNCSAKTFGVPDIGTLVTDDDGVTPVGNNHTYRVEVKNQGQIPLTNVKMSVTLPDGMTFVSSTDGKSTGNKVEFAFGTLAPGATKASTFVVKATKSGELLVIGETTCTEIKTPIRDDELTNFVDQ